MEAQGRFAWKQRILQGRGTTGIQLESMQQGDLRKLPLKNNSSGLNISELRREIRLAGSYQSTQS